MTEPYASHDSRCKQNRTIQACKPTTCGLRENREQRTNIKSEKKCVLCVSVCKKLSMSVWEAEIASWNQECQEIKVQWSRRENWGCACSPDQQGKAKQGTWHQAAAASSLHAYEERTWWLSLLNMHSLRLYAIFYLHSSLPALPEATRGMLVKKKDTMQAVKTTPHIH